MAEEKNEQQAGEKKQKKKLPLKMVITLAAVFLIEAGAISALFLMFGGPKESGAVTSPDELALLEQVHEQQLVSGRFTNNKTGKTKIFQVEIYVGVREKNRKAVDKLLETKGKLVQARIGEIFRQAEPAQLIDPNLTTLERQIKAALDDMVGYDKQGQPLIETVFFSEYFSH